MHRTASRAHVQESSPSHCAIGNPVLYTELSGRRLDPETILYYYRARYYHAGLGKFVSRDPIRYEAEDENLYQYVRGMPTFSTDPSGLAGSTQNPWPRRHTRIALGPGESEPILDDSIASRGRALRLKKESSGHLATSPATRS